MTLARIRSFRLVPILGAASVALPSIAIADPPPYLQRSVVAAATHRAIAHAGLLPERTREIAIRARNAGLLPVLSLRVMRGFGATSALNAALPTSDHYASDDSLVLDFRARFQLDRLVFDRSEVSLERIEMARGDRRDALEREVIDLLATLAQANLVLESADPGSSEAMEARLATARATARLEALTGASIQTLLRVR
jgi:hypothetical protein